jgi:hypothetical protein
MNNITLTTVTPQLASTQFDPKPTLEGTHGRNH